MMNSDVWVESKRGRLYYGPKCARIMGLTDMPKWQRREGCVLRKGAPKAVPVDPRQIPLEFAA